MKKIVSLMIAILLIAAFAAACTPGALVDTLNGLGGATPGNAFRFATPGNAASFATPGNAASLATPGNIGVLVSPGNVSAATPGNAQ